MFSLSVFAICTMFAFSCCISLSVYDKTASIAWLSKEIEKVTLCIAAVSLIMFKYAYAVETKSRVSFA